MLKHLYQLSLLLLITTTLVGKIYKGAEYRTKQSYLYGRFTVRMQSADGDGVVSSFFTFRDYYAEGLTDPKHWNEIDLEWLGLRDNKVSTNVIIQNEWGDASEVFLTTNPHLSFNTYSFEWTPEAIRFYEGDRLIRTVSGERADSVYHAQKIMMNIWWPSNTSWVGVFDISTLPRYAFYDWVSYAAYTPGEGSVGTDNNFTPMWKDDFDTWDTERWEKASHTWVGNNVDFTPSNAVIQYGHLILCMTNSTELGYTGPALSTEPELSQTPSAFYLSQPFPNPFNGSVNLSVALDTPSDLHVRVYDLTGKLIKISELKNTGSHDRTIRWEGRDLDGNQVGSGTYIIQVSAEQQQLSRKVVLIQ